MTQTKTCNQCKRKLHLSQFSKDKSRKTGVSYRCKSCQSKLHKKYYTKNSICVLQKHSNYRQNHSESCKLRSKKYRDSHRIEINAYLRRYSKYRYYNDIQYRLKRCLRVRLYKALKRNTKFGRTINLLGCSIEQFKIYLAGLFQPGMSWTNYGKWEVDHIKPCAKFDLSKPEEQKECFHYSNLQPLWLKDNRLKSDE